MSNILPPARTASLDITPTDQPRKTILPNLAFPIRPAGPAPWSDSSSPTLYTKTEGVRHHTSFVYTNPTDDENDGFHTSFEGGLLKRVKDFLSHNMSLIWRKIKLFVQMLGALNFGPLLCWFRAVA